MELFQITYYVGLALALILCWNLGALFYSLILFGMFTNVLLDVGWLTSGDMRLKWTIIKAINCLWVIILANIFRSRKEAIAIFLLVMAAFTYAVYPSLVEAADSWKRWVELTTSIMRGWAAINFGIISIVMVKTVYLWKTGAAPNDLVVNPRKRFLIPIWAFSAIVAVPIEWIPWFTAWFDRYRFSVAAHVNVWGWVFLELKFFVQAYYWRKKYGNR